MTVSGESQRISFGNAAFMGVFGISIILPTTPERNYAAETWRRRNFATRSFVVWPDSRPHVLCAEATASPDRDACAPAFAARVRARSSAPPHPIAHTWRGAAWQRADLAVR